MSGRVSGGWSQWPLNLTVWWSPGLSHLEVTIAKAGCGHCQPTRDVAHTAHSGERTQRTEFHKRPEAPRSVRTPFVWKRGLKRGHCFQAAWERTCSGTRARTDSQPHIQLPLKSAGYHCLTLLLIQILDAAMRRTPQVPQEHLVCPHSVLPGHVSPRNTKAYMQ